MKRVLIVFLLLLLILATVFPIGFSLSGVTGEGPEGLLGNPASIGFHDYNVLSILGEYGDSGVRKSEIFVGNTLGLTYSEVNGTVSYSLLFGLGFNLSGDLYAGYSMSFDNIDSGLREPSFNFGLLGFPADYLGLGLYQRNLFGGTNSTLNGSIGLRPLYLFNRYLGKRLTLFADASIPVDISDMAATKERLASVWPDIAGILDYSFGLSLKPIDGFALGFESSKLDSFRASLGIDLDDVSLSLSVSGSYDLSGYSIGFGVGWNHLPVKSALRMPEKNYLIKLDKPFEKTNTDMQSIYNLDSFVSRLYELAEDPGWRNIYVIFDQPVVTSVDSLEALVKVYSYLKSKGKRIVTYINNSFSQLDYLAAASGTEVIVPPESFIYLVGVGGNFLFFKQLLDRQGIEVEYARSSEYKSALDSFIRDKLSKENREQYTAYIETIYNLFKEVLASRGFDEGRAGEIIDNGPYDGTTAKKIGLVDGVMYYDEFRQRYVDRDSTAKFEVVRYREEDWKRKPVIAFFKMSGPVVNSNSLSPIDYLTSTSYITEKNTIPFLRIAKEDKRVRAVIISIDSPGGDGIVSDKIWHAITELKKVKPVVVVMGSVAASGGYYIAMAGDYIIAGKTTLTGSIGAFTYKFAVKNFLARYGITTDSVSFGKNFNIFSPFSGLSREQKEKVKALNDSFVRNFYLKVSESRGIPLESVKEIGGGRIYSGEKALRLKLVDDIGDFEDALQYLEKRLNLDRSSFKVEYYPDKEALLKLFLEESYGLELDAGKLIGNLMLKTLFLTP